VSERVFIVGAGKVGRGLALALRSAHVDVVGVHGRSPHEGTTSSGPFPAPLAEANVVIVRIWHSREQRED